MRSYVVAHVLAMSLAAIALAPRTSDAQVYSLPERAPRTTAASDGWQRSGQPVYFAGGLYDPSGPTEFFDGNVMSRVGAVEGVPVYENRTLEPWSVIYVPVGRNQMRPYERRRAGRLAGTVGSRAPVRPIQRDAELNAALPSFGDNGLAAFEATGDTEYLEVGRAVDGGGRARWDYTPTVTAPEPPPLTSVPDRRPSTAAPGTVFRTVPQHDTMNAGAYVEFAGVRYFTSGRAVVNHAEQFTRAGDARGAVVYRAVKGDAKTIYVEVVPGGTLAPYSRR